MPATRLALLALPTLALGLLAPAALGQSVLYSFDVEHSAISGAGDVNGDGFGDLIVGYSLDDNNGTDSGSARVYSGADGSIIWSWDGDSADDRFGKSVSGAGDVNGDGYDDLIVGAPGDTSTPVNIAGSARVYSGADGSIIWSWDGDSVGDIFGASVSGAGDVNGDGFDDVIVGVRFDDNNAPDSGSARVFSGTDGSILYTFDGDSQDDQFGISVSGAGDVDGDGFDDVVVGAHLDDNTGANSGSARIFSGADGSVIYTFDGDSKHDWFGASVSGAGDVNGDGFDDVVVGAFLDDKNGADSGSALVFSGADGSVIYAFAGDSKGDSFGMSVSGAGDVNGDGYADLIVGAFLDDNKGNKSGSARVFSGVDGSVLYTIDGDSAEDAFGASVSGAGDVDGDGYDDLIVGAPGIPRVRVFSGWSPVGTSYCGPAASNSTGLPAAILALGSETVTDQLLWLRATDLPPNKWGYFLASETQGFVANPGGSQGNLCLGGKIGRYAKQVQKSGMNGVLTIQVDLTSIPTSPPHTVVAGETWNFQAWYRDSNPGNTSNFTDAVSVTFL